MPQEINPWNNCQERSARQHLPVQPKPQNRVAKHKNDARSD